MMMIVCVLLVFFVCGLNFHVTAGTHIRSYITMYAIVLCKLNATPCGHNKVDIAFIMAMHL